MSEHPIEGLMTTAMNNIKDMVDVNTIIGEPIETSNNVVIIPISKVCFGFAAGGSMSSKYITQNVEINNRFEGDRAGQQRSAEAMDKAAGDATSELARGLAYVR